MIEQIPKKTLLQPSTSSDLSMSTDDVHDIFPAKLFNFIAWADGTSDFPGEDEYVEMKDAESKRILAIAQDLDHLASKGRKTIPKQISLAIAIRHLSGSTDRPHEQVWIQCLTYIYVGT